MNEKKVNLVAIIFALFLVVVIALTSVAIYKTPTEVVAGTAGNYSINLTNGGHILEDDGFLFYTIPGQKGVYRVEKGKPETNKKISDIGDGNLQIVGSGYYFTDDDTLYRIDWDGNKRQVVLKNATAPKVVGSLVFYQKSNTGSTIYKYSMKNDNEFDVVSDLSDFGRRIQEYLVYYRKVYSVEPEGIYKTSITDYSNRELFIKADAKRLSIDGQYLFFVENGTLKSVVLKDKQIVKTDLMKLKAYAVYGNTCVYCDGKKTYFADINKFLTQDGYKPKVLADAPAKGISIDDENFYFFNKGKLKKVTHEGKNLTEIN